MNQIQVKKTVKAGNSSAVILPRSWLNKEVRVELIKKTPEKILSDVIGIIQEYVNLSEIIGVYLTGSRARGEEDSESDIDILVLAQYTDKEMISDGIYNILIISTELLKQKLKTDIFPIGQMIKESKPLINSEYLESIEVKITKDNVKWYLDTTEEKINLINKVINLAKANKNKHLSDRIAYTLILRIRTMYIINSIIHKESYSKKEFIKKIRNIKNVADAYERYLAVKNNLEEKNGIRVEEAEYLNEYLKRLLLEIKDKVQ